MPRDRRLSIGSSMGGWIALLLLRELRRRKAAGTRRQAVAGLVLIAPAVDFTEVLMWQRFPAEGEARDRGQGRLAAPVRLWRALSDHARA